MGQTMNVETITYKDFEISVVHNQPAWQAQIIPPYRSAVVIPHHLQFASKATKDGAIAEAKRIIEDLLAGN
jgi:hypothetical protein